jgi:hypothetical protein
MIECSDKVTGAMVNGTGSFVPPSSGACPARVPPRAAGLQAALAGAARRVTRPRPRGRRGRRQGRGRPAGWRQKGFEFPSMLPLLSSSLEYFSSPPIFFGAVSPGPDRSGGFLWRWDLASPTTFYPCGFKHPSPDSLYVF